MTRAWVEIDLGALARNAARFAGEAGCPLLPMVKADAYGLGAVRVARALDGLAWGFGVATVEEGEELRRAGIKKPVLVFSPLLPAQFDAVRRSQLRPVLGDRSAIEQWVGPAGRASHGPIAAAKGRKKKVDDAGAAWHLMIDTGMSRAGVSWRNLASVADLVAAHAPEGICTHFHSAQLPDGSREEQEGRLSRCIEELGVQPKYVHADNSAAVEHRAPSPYSFARPGIFLYGVGSGHGARFEPEPVVAVRGRVVEVRVIQEGDIVGYDASWRARRAGRIATVSIGYADGYRRALGNRATALIGGEPVPVVGHVSMDMTTLDVTDKRCEPGDVVTFLGRDGNRVLAVSEIAAAAELSPYEILTGLRGRLPRVYLEVAAADAGPKARRMRSR